VIKNLEVFPKKTYLELLWNAEGCRLFRSSYFIQEGKLVDLCRKGKYACAHAVSRILLLMDCNLIHTPHLTVEGLEFDLCLAGWEAYSAENPPDPDQLLPGAILIWEPRTTRGDKTPHRHCGFYLGGALCLSNDPQTKKLSFHNITFKGTRKLERFYLHDFLRIKEPSE
jgi:hypothetical protein